MDVLEKIICDVKRIAEVHDSIESLREGDIISICGSMDTLKKDCAAAEKKLRSVFDESEERSETQVASSISIIEEDIKKLKHWYDVCGYSSVKKKRKKATSGFKPDMKRLDTLHSDFILDPFWLKGANIVTLGAYKRNLLDSFYTSCEAGIIWYNDQIAEIKRNRAAEKKRREEKLASDIQNLKNKLSQDLLPLERKLARQHAKHDESVLSMVCNSADINELYNKLGALSVEWGLTRNAWNNYIPSEMKPEHICLGYARIPTKFTAFTSKSLLETKFSTFYSETSGILVPFCVPIDQNIAIEYSEEKRSEVVDGIQGVLARVIKSMPAKAFEVTFVDPIGRGGSLGRLIKLSETDPHNCPLFHTPAATKSEIAEQLKKVVDHIGVVSKKLADMGTNTTIDDYNSSHPDKIKHHLVVIEDFTEGLDPSFIDYLKVITGEAAKKCGVSVILCTNRKFMPKERFLDFYKEYLSKAIFVTEESDGMKCSYNDTPLKVKLVDASKMSDIYISEVYSEYVKKLELDNSAERFYGSSVPFEYKDATKALKIPFAVNGKTNEIVEMELGGSTTSFAMITGTQGSGKSTTLHAIIVGLMANYHPDDVELWLVDYKMTEFSTMYRGKRLPHVKYIGLENSPEFTYGILDKVREEFERRGSILKKFGFQDIKRYMVERNKQIAEGAKDVLPPMPRIVLIMDEVSNLASHINERAEYKEFFEHMIRTYRAFGLCAVFADQYPIANNHGITDDAQDLIMTRMAMSHNLQHMKSTLLLTSNDYSDELLNDMSNMSSGDIIYKYKVEYSDWTTETIISKYKSVYLKEHEIEEIIARINKQLPDTSFVDKEMKTIESSERVLRDGTLIKKYAAEHPLGDEENIGMYLGSPTTFEECFRFELSSRRSNNVLLISSNRDLNYSAVINSVRSFQSYKGNKTIIIAHPKSKLYKLNKEEIERIPEVNSDVLVICEIEKASSCLEHYSQQVKNREESGNVLIVFLGVEEWFEDFAVEGGNEINAPIWTAQSKNTIKSSTGKKLSSSDIASQLSELDELFPDDDEDDLDEIANEVVVPTEEKRINLDARGYFDTILQMGSRYNVYTLASFESPMEFLQTKIKPEHFGHKIVGAIQKADAYNIAFPAQPLSIFSNKTIADSNLLYSNGIGEPLRFRPYLNK